jgi:hypothetical protein
VEKSQTKAEETFTPIENCESHSRVTSSKLYKLGRENFQLAHALNNFCCREERDYKYKIKRREKGIDSGAKQRRLLKIEIN